MAVTPALTVMDFERHPGGPILDQGYHATLTNPTRILIDYTPASTGVPVRYDLHQELFLYHSGTIRDLIEHFPGALDGEHITNMMEMTRETPFLLKNECYEAWPSLFTWMYTWKSNKRKHMNNFNPVVGGGIMPLLALADYLYIEELILDLVIFVRNEEQRGNSLDKYLSQDHITQMAKRQLSPVAFQHLCDHWNCHRAAKDGSYQCDNADQDGVCQEPNHRFGIGSFALEHWTTTCPSRRNRASEMRQILKSARMFDSRWKSEAEKNDALKYEPSPAELTCTHFGTRRGSRIQLSSATESARRHYPLGP